MMNAKLKIELLSNACIALGSSYGEASDMDVYLDKQGKPYIPSKRIKGLIRSAIEEYNNISNKPIDINKLLGSPVIEGETITKGQGGSLYIENAYSSNDINTVSIKTQTAIDNKTHQAKTGSLRTTKVVNKGAIFTSNITLDKEDYQNLKNILPLLRHMGLNRNRGLGLIKVTIEEDYSSNKKLNSSIINKNTKLVKIKIKNISNLMISSVNANESISYIPSSTILGYFANKYIKLTNNETKLKKLFLDDNHLIFSNAYISDDDYNEYIPCPQFIKKFKNLSSDGRVDYINKFLNESDKSENKVERKIASLDGKYIRANVFNESVDKENFIALEPEYEYAYHHSLDKDGKVNEFYQFFSLERDQHFVSYVYGDYDKLQELFKVVNDRIVYFGKSKNSQYGKCEIEIEIVKEQQLKGNVLIFKAPVSIVVDNKEILEANEIAKKISLNSSVTNYSLKYTNLGGFNMLWGLPKIARTAIDGGSYIEFENVNSSDIVNFLDKCGVSRLDYMLVNSSDIIKFKEAKSPVKTSKLKARLTLEEEVLTKALNKYESTKNRVKLNSTQIERVLMLINETSSLRNLNDQIEQIASVSIKDKIKKIINNLNNEYDENNYKLYLITYFNLLKWEGRGNESTKQ